MSNEWIEEFINSYKWPLMMSLIGIGLLGIGVIFLNRDFYSSSSIEVLSIDTSTTQETNTIVVEISGAVKNPGVYSFSDDARINDAIILAGGLDRENKVWVEKFINKASKLKDGQKIYIPFLDEQSIDVSATKNTGDQTVSDDMRATATTIININTASQSELESLWGIGPVYAKNIIEHRPYSDISELIEKSIIKQNVYDRNKDLITVY